MLISVKLDNCILGKSTQVGQKAELTRCVTQAGYEVAKGGQRCRLYMCCADISFTPDIVKGEKLEVSDWMADPDTPVLQHKELQLD